MRTQIETSPGVFFHDFFGVMAMKCIACRRAITPLEARRAADISVIGFALCVRCAESIAAVGDDEGDDCTDSKNPPDPS